jgi:hypothetical protein
MLSGVQYQSLLAGWQSIRLIWQMFDRWGCPPGRSIEVKAGGKGELSDNLNAATQSCTTFDQDAFTISEVSDVYPAPVICLIWAGDTFYIAGRFWVLCHIGKEKFSLGRIALSGCMGSISAVWDTPVADYSAPKVNTMRQVAYRPPSAVSPFLLALSVFCFQQPLCCGGQLWPYVGMGSLCTCLHRDCNA